MSLSDKIVGMHFRYPDHYVVGREKIREYAVAVKNDDRSFFEDKAAAELGYCGLLAPLTFISVFGYQAQSAFFANAEVEIKDVKIVQVDQVLKFVKPITVGDTPVLRRLRRLGAPVIRHGHHCDEEHHHERRRRSGSGDLYHACGS